MNPRKPTALLKLQGTYRPDRHSRNQPEPATRGTALPRWAELTGYGAKCYKRLAPILASMRVMTEADTEALVMMCERYHQYKTLSKAIEGHDPEDALRVLPSRDKAYVDFMKGLTEFGMTPASRSKVSMTAKADEDPFEALAKQA